MSLLVHLSDFHISPAGRKQQRIFDGLIDALSREVQEVEPPSVLVVITGDVFESATQPAAPAVESFVRLHERIVNALGGDAPTVVIPGNHDRRTFGYLGPFRTELFERLQQSVDRRRVWVAGTSGPLLAQVVPREFHRLPAHLIAYDSTFVPGGLIGAGGTLRVEDLLMAHAQLPDDGLPLVLLVHHHLIPTPLTDVNHIDPTSAKGVTRWLLDRALPFLISYGDREELTMTALGAGTALSTLHSFQRPVLLLHGHKHMPTARLLTGLTEACGDVLIASAGSAGTRERVHGARHPDAARLWPSFNRITIGAGHFDIEALSFSPKHTGRPFVRRHLAHAVRRGRKWSPEPVRQPLRGPRSRVAEDRAEYTLHAANEQRWDLECSRYVQLDPGATLKRYVDFVDARPRDLPARVRGNILHVELTLGGITRYRVNSALARTRKEAAAVEGVGTAFEWVGLLCRYGAARAELSLRRIELAGAPFASLTDLSTGRERALPLESDPERWFAVVEECTPRSLLRIYWPLDGE